MSIDEIEHRLDDRFALLRGGDRSAPERHRTLLAVIEWSWRLLDAGAQDLLTRLALFPDGLAVDAVEAVAAPDRRLDALDDLAELVEQSLVQLVEVEGEPVRYRLLETVREFGAARLDERGTTEAVRTAMIRWGGTSPPAGTCSRSPVRTSSTASPRRPARGRQPRHPAPLEPPHRRPSATAHVFAALGAYWTLRGAHGEVTAIASDVVAVLRSGPPAAEDLAAVHVGLVVAGASSAFRRPPDRGVGDLHAPALPPCRDDGLPGARRAGRPAPDARTSGRRHRTARAPPRRPRRGRGRHRQHAERAPRRERRRVRGGAPVRHPGADTRGAHRRRVDDRHRGRHHDAAPRPDGPVRGRPRERGPRAGAARALRRRGRPVRDRLDRRALLGRDRRRGHRPVDRRRAAAPAGRGARRLRRRPLPDRRARGRDRRGVPPVRGRPRRRCRAVHGGVGLGAAAPEGDTALDGDGRRGADRGRRRGGARRGRPSRTAPPGRRTRGRSPHSGRPPS